MEVPLYVAPVQLESLEVSSHQRPLGQHSALSPLLLVGL